MSGFRFCSAHQHYHPDCDPCDLAALLTALRPFAEYWEAVERRTSPDSQLWQWPYPITVAAFEQAADVYRRLKGEK